MVRSLAINDLGMLNDYGKKAFNYFNSASPQCETFSTWNSTFTRSKFSKIGRTEDTSDIEQVCILHQQGEMHIFRAMIILDILEEY